MHHFRVLLAVALLASAALLLAASPYSRPEHLSPADVQRVPGPGGDSPWLGQKVAVEGVVTAVSPHGRFYYLADPAGGAWSGLKVMGASLERARGELLQVLGVVEEFYGETRLAERSVRRRGTASLPPATPLGVRDLRVDAERWEGVLVKIENVTVEEETSRYGEFPLSDATGSGALADDEFFHSYIADPGDTFAAITGVVSFGFGEFRIEPRSDDDLEGWVSVRGFDAVIEFTVIDEAGRPLPSKVTFFPVSGGALELGPYDRAEGSEDVAYLNAGAGEVAIPSGTYNLVISRGIEYGLHEERVSVGPGGRAAVFATLAREVDSTGWISGDFHLHSAPSFDTPLPVPGRIVSLAAEGVEWAIATDHNMVTDYAPLIEELGLAGWMTSSIGDEITTSSPRFGHFNAWPLNAGREPPRYWGLDPAALFAAARSDVGVEIVQVNHPVIEGSDQYFQVYDVNPFTGVPEEPGFSFDFDALEIMNGRYIDQGVSNFETWMRMLNDGRHITATGNSDSHHLVFAEPGYPRNYVESSVDDPELVREEDLVQAVLDGRVFVTYGPLVEFTVNGAGLGRLITVSGEPVTLDARVQLPSWLEGAEGHVYANAEKIATFPISAEGAGSLDLSWQGQHLPERDTWFLLFVEGAGDLAPVRRGEEFRPLAFTNPIWVDFDGDGEFTPPGNFSTPDDIAEIDAVDASGVPTRIGEWVVLDGCARTDTRFLDPGSGIFYLEDGTGGVQVREEIGSLTDVVRGDRVQVAGFVGQVLGETIVTDALVDGLPGEAPCGPAIAITTGEIAPGVEPFEGRVVRIISATRTAGSWPVGGVAGSVTIDDGTGPATLVIPAGVVVPGEVAALPEFSLTALVTQRDFAAPFDSGYRLTLRSGEDVFVTGATSAVPSVALAARPHPNPFRSALTIPLGEVPAPATRVEIHDVAGRRVVSLAPDAGETELVWDGTDDRGRAVGSGVYFVRWRDGTGRKLARIVKLD